MLNGNTIIIKSLDSGHIKNDLGAKTGYYTINSILDFYAGLTSYHQHSDLNNSNVLSHSSVGQKSHYGLA